MRRRPGSSGQLRAAATLPAGVPPPGPGPGHAGSRGRKLQCDYCPEARLVGGAGAKRKRDGTKKAVIPFASCQEQCSDSHVAAESPFFSVGGRRREIFQSRTLKENFTPYKEKPRNTDGGVPGTGGPHAPPTGKFTRVQVLASRLRCSWAWLGETEGRHPTQPYLRTWRRGGTRGWAWLWAAAALLAWWCPAAATAGGCRVPATESE